MARKVVTYTVSKDNRDNGKSFEITEMSAVAGHRWASRALFAMLNSGLSMPEELAKQGLAGLAVMGMGAITNIPYAMAEPLLDELMECVKIKEEKITRATIVSDFEEITTIFDLQKEVLMLHIGPFIQGVRQTLASSQTTPAPAG